MERIFGILLAIYLYPRYLRNLREKKFPADYADLSLLFGKFRREFPN